MCRYSVMLRYVERSLPREYREGSQRADRGPFDGARGGGGKRKFSGLSPCLARFQERVLIGKFRHILIIKDTRNGQKIEPRSGVDAVFPPKPCVLQEASAYILRAWIFVTVCGLLSTPRSIQTPRHTARSWFGRLPFLKATCRSTRHQKLTVSSVHSPSQTQVSLWRRNSQH